VEGFGEFVVMAQPEAVAADVDDVAVMEEAVGKDRRHDFITEDLPPLLEALVGGQYGRGALVTAVDELEEEHRAGLGNGQIADFVNDEECGVSQRLNAMRELASSLRDCDIITD